MHPKKPNMSLVYYLPKSKRAITFLYLGCSIRDSQAEMNGTKNKIN